MATLSCLLALSSALNAANREILLARTFWACAWVESRGDPRAVNRAEDAVGIVQVRPIMVADANRILGRSKYNLADRLDVQKSWEMFRLVVRYYYPSGTPEQWARTWNGGPKGSSRPATLAYWRKVQAELSRAR